MRLDKTIQNQRKELFKRSVAIEKVGGLLNNYASFDFENKIIKIPNGFRFSDSYVLFDEVELWNITKTERDVGVVSNDIISNTEVSEKKNKKNNRLFKSVVGAIVTLPLGGIGAVAGLMPSKESQTDTDSNMMDYLESKTTTDHIISNVALNLYTSLQTKPFKAFVLYGDHSVYDINTVKALEDLSVMKTIMERVKPTEKVVEEKSRADMINNLDALLKLKELLDAGIITQGEFDVKKQTLL